MVKIVNLTPHPINIIGLGEIKPSGIVARLEETTTVVGSLYTEDGGKIPLIKKRLGKLINLPDADPIYPLGKKVYVNSTDADYAPKSDYYWVPPDTVEPIKASSSGMFDANGKEVDYDPLEENGLPEPVDYNTYYIVSLPVALAAKRADVLAIGETIRNDNGQVIGAKSLAVV